MPIHNGYSIDAYCDCEQCRSNTTIAGNYVKEEMISAAGESYAECAAEIRYHGWYLSRDRQRTLAPGHIKPKNW